MRQPSAHLLDERGDALRSFDLASSLPEFSRFAHWTTAGMAWSQQMLAYFTAGQRHFVARAWWGARLVIDLDRLQRVDPGGLSGELDRTESELVLRGLQDLVARIEGGERPRYDGPSTDVVHCTLGTLAHFPGLLGLAQAVPMLRVLEERPGDPSQCFSSFNYHFSTTRQLAQISLRRLGEKPRCHPALWFSSHEKRAPLRRPQPGPVGGADRHANGARVGRSTPLAEVYRLLGAPDEIGRGASRDFWRYDVDADPPYTMLLWLDDNDAVARTVRYLPPFWTGPDAFPSREHSLLDSDGTTVYAHVEELENGTFVGTRLEVDVLQDLAASGRYPLAPLARAILDGSLDALGPLADALEEADDPLAPQIRNWIKA